jgi:hypothetical protein
MPPKRPPRQNEKNKPKTKTRQRTFLILLLAVNFAITCTILALGTRRFYTWYQTTRPLKRQNDVLCYTIVFLLVCTPSCVYLGILIAAGYYWRKKRKYGEYKIIMRRKEKGRGYWADPTDLEDSKKEAEAERVNKAIEEIAAQGSTKVEGKEKTIKFKDKLAVPALQHISMFLPFRGSTVVASELQRDTSTSRNYSSINPYGWFPKTEEPVVPQRQLGRSDSVKRCEDSPVVKKGVVDIWLNSFGNRESDGRAGGMSKWDEDVEMGTFG